MVKVICHNYGNDCDFEVQGNIEEVAEKYNYHSEQKHGIEYSKETCLLYTSPSPRDPKTSRMPSSA